LICIPWFLLFWAKLKEGVSMKQRPRLFLLVPLLTLALVAGVLMQPLSTHAATHAAFQGTPHFFWAKGRAPNSGSGGNLLYHGGPVVVNKMTAYAIFWEPDHTFVGSTYNSLLMRYFRDVGDSPLYENNEQYTDTSGGAPLDAVLGGSWVDKAPYPSVPFVLDSDIQNEVTHAMNVNGWTPGIHHAFFVFTSLNEFICMSPHLSDCSAPFGGFCAYHSSFGDANSPTLYGAMPYDGNFLAGCYALNTSPNRNAAADAEISTTSHEQIELATDPLVNVPNLGSWYDAAGNEIGDKCAYVYGPLKKNGANVSWNGHSYVVQGEWDNAVSGCVLSGP